MIKILYVSLVISNFYSCKNDIDSSKPKISESKEISTENINIVKDTIEVDCFEVIDSIYQLDNLCSKSFVSFLTSRSTRCGKEMYNELIKKSISVYKETKSYGSYEKIECISKYADGSISEYLGMKLVTLLIENPSDFCRNMILYENQNKKSYIKDILINDALYFGSKEGIDNAIISNLSEFNSEEKLWLQTFMNLTSEGN